MSSTQPKFSDQETVELLKYLQSQGITNIDEAIIKYSPAKIENNPVENPTFEITNQPSKTIEASVKAEIEDNQAQAQTLTSATPKPDNQANLMLYLGAALVVISTLVFVAFNWQTFSPFIQSLIIIIINLAFYVAGFLIKKFENIKEASTTFLIIASVMAGLTGIGLWNFWLQEVLLISFSAYWLVYSVILLMAYTLTFIKLQKDPFKYLTLAAIYSICFSLSLTLSSDTRFQIVILSILNLLLYIGHPWLGKLTGSVAGLSRVINQVLQVLIILIITRNILNIQGTTSVWIALIALLIPILFNLAVAIKNKTAEIPESYALATLGPINLLIISFIFKLNIEHIFLVQIVYVAFINGLKLLWLKNQNIGKYLYWLGKFLGWSNILCLLVVGPYLRLSLLTWVLTLLILTGLILISSDIVQKYWVQAGFGLLTVPLIFLYWFFNQPQPPSVTFLIIVFSLYFYTCLGWFVYSEKTNNPAKWLTFPSLWVAGSLVFWTSAIKGGYEAFWGLTTLGLGISIGSRVTKYNWSDFLSIPIILTGFGFLTSTLYYQNLVSHDLWISGIFLIVFLLYATIYHINRSNNILRLSSLLGMLANGLVASFVVVNQQHSLVWVQSLFLLYGFFCIWKYRSIFGSIYALVIYTLWLFLISNLFNPSLEIGMALFGASAFGLAYLSTLKLEKYKNPQLTGLIGSIVFSVAILFEYFINLYIKFTIYGLLTILFVFFGWFILGKKYHIFYYLCGIPWVLLTWHLGLASNIENSLFYVSLLSLYLFIVGLGLQYENKKQIGQAYELGAYSLELVFLIILSLPQSNWQHTLYAITTIALSAIIVMLNLQRNFQPAIKLAIGSIIIAIIILFYRTAFWIIGLTPWYIYVFLIGLALILGAIYILSKGSKNDK